MASSQPLHGMVDSSQPLHVKGDGGSGWEDQQSDSVGG